MGSLTAGPAVEPGSTGASRNTLLSSSLGLIAGKACLMGLGFGFWLLAARRFPAGEVGITAGAISAILLCVQVALVGIGSAVISEYHRREPRALLDTSLTLVIMTAMGTGGVLLLLARNVFPELSVVGASVLFASLFLAMGVLGTVGVLADQVSMAQARGDQILVRSLVNGVVTIVPLLIGGSFLDWGAPGLFGFWTVGAFSACLVAGAQLARSPIAYTYRPALVPEVARRLIRAGLPNYALTVTERAPGLVLPIIVLEILSPEANAYWYTAWMMAWGCYVIPTSMSIALFAHVAHDRGSLLRQTDAAVRFSLGVSALAAVILIGAARPLLSLLGAEYAAAGVTPLRFLVLAVFPITMAQAYFGVARAAEALREAIVTSAVAAVVSVAVTSAGGVRWGLTGMALCWVATQVLLGGWSAWRLRVICQRHSIAAAPSSLLPSPSPLAGA